jgi:hypothetical protein
MRTLEIGNIIKVSEGKYGVHIGIVDKDADFYAPYRIITIEATNKEFARRIAEIRVEEMMISDCKGSIRAVTEHNALLKSKEKHFNKYIEIKNQEEALWTAQEEALTRFIKDAQPDEMGINVRSFDIKVDLDGEQPYLVYAIRTWVDDSSEYVELLVSFTGDEDDLEWCSIYDFYCGTAGEILNTLVEGV